MLISLINGLSEAFDKERNEQLLLNDSNSSLSSDVVWYLLVNFPPYTRVIRAIITIIKNKNGTKIKCKFQNWSILLLDRLNGLALECFINTGVANASYEWSD